MLYIEYYYSLESRPRHIFIVEPRSIIIALSRSVFAGDNLYIKPDLLQQQQKYDSFTPLAHDSLPMLLLRKLMATYKRGWK
jgi:hypothetical protein